MEALKLRCIVAARETLLEDKQIEYAKIDKLEAMKMVKDAFEDPKSEQPRIEIPELSKPSSPAAQAKRRVSIGLIKPSTPVKEPMKSVTENNTNIATIKIEKPQEPISQPKEAETVNVTPCDTFKLPSTTNVPKRRRSRSELANLSIDIIDDDLIDRSVVLLETTTDRFPNENFNMSVKLTNQSSNEVEIMSKPNVVVTPPSAPLDNITLSPEQAKEVLQTPPSLLRSFNRDTARPQPTGMPLLNSIVTDVAKENQVRTQPTKSSALPIPSKSVTDTTNTTKTTIAGAKPIYAPKNRPTVRTITILPKKRETEPKK